MRRDAGLAIGGVFSNNVMPQLPLARMILGPGAALGLPSRETRAVVLLASIALGSNVSLMARQFEVLEGTVAQSQLVTTLFSAVTTPLPMALVP